MKSYLYKLVIGTAVFFVITTPAMKNAGTIANQATPTPESFPKIQAAILLDVSNSMDGLIEQAKAQLWNMVSVMGKAQCDGLTPNIEIALYEYGRSDNNVSNGYVKQISGFASDLDKLSQQLFHLTTNGGDEYCGQVIYTSLKELNWDHSPSNYKVIFIAGNEDFLQGNLPYLKACNEAKRMGVTINTIYCGSKIQGINEHWNLAETCGPGSFTNIDQDAKMEDIPTPYDSILFALNNNLNNTYLTFGAYGTSAHAAQASVDEMNYKMNKSVEIKRIAVKSKKELYKNSNWDMVDAAENQKDFADKVDLKTLPDSLQKKSRKEIRLIISKKSEERTRVQKQIETISLQREKWLEVEKKKSSSPGKAATLETEIEKIVKKQAAFYRMVIK